MRNNGEPLGLNNGQRPAARIFQHVIGATIRGSAHQAGTGVPCEVTPSVRDIALRCGRAFGLGLYGLDIIEGPDGPVVVDLNYSPGFRGVPDAAQLLTDLFLSALRCC